MGTLAQQQLDNLVVAFIRCRLERAAIVSAFRVKVGTLAQQQLENYVEAFRGPTDIFTI